MPGLFRSRTFIPFIAIAALLLTAAAAPAQRLTGTENGEWRYLGGDAGHTRSSALDQIDGDNFSELEVAWIWRGDNFGPNIDYFNRATPIYVDGVVYTVASPRRQVVAIDPGTGETLWTFREPESVRHLRSPRQAYGKGVAYAEVNGRGVIFVTSPAFFLWALDAETGRPLEDWGRPIPLDGRLWAAVVHRTGSLSSAGDTAPPAQWLLARPQAWKSLGPSLACVLPSPRRGRALASGLPVRLE